MSRAVIRTKEKPSLPVPVKGGVSAGACELPALPPAASALTQHLADVGLDVDVLQMLVRVRVVEPQGRVQADGHPHPVADPCQLPHLALPPRVRVKRLLWAGGRQGGVPAGWRWAPGRGGARTSICMVLGWMMCTLFL